MKITTLKHCHGIGVWYSPDDRALMIDLLFISVRIEYGI
jgi:hypothetical protein